MAIYTNLPVYKASYNLMLMLNRLIPTMSRDCRYSLGQDARNKIMEIILFIYRANRTRQKLPFISSMKESLLEVQVYVRLMCDLKYISEKKYMELAELCIDISKQMAAWEKSEINKNAMGR